MRIAVGFDHAGYPLREAVVPLIERAGHHQRRVDQIGAIEAGRLPAGAEPEPLEKST